MKASELCQTAKRAGLSEFGTIRYRTRKGDWRYNVGLYVDGVWSFDCLGFVHCMVNGFCGNKEQLGGGAVMDEFVTNATEAQTLYNYCYDQSYNFTKLTAGELLYMDGHVGLYIGECEPFNDGRIFNVAECCYSSFGGGGMLTYVSPTGTRYNHKGGATAGAWSAHAKFYRVDYKEEEVTPIIEVDPATVLNIVNDTFIGVYGNNPLREKEITKKFGKDTYRKVQDIINILYR